MDFPFLLLFVSALFLLLSLNAPRVVNVRKLELTELEHLFTEPLLIDVREGGDEPPVPPNGQHRYLLTDGTTRITYDFGRMPNGKSSETMYVDVPHKYGVSITFGNEEVESLTWQGYRQMLHPDIMPRGRHEAIELLRRVRARVCAVLALQRVNTKR